MGQEYVFRFLSVRPPDPEKKLERSPTKVPLFPPSSRSPLRAEVAKVEGTPDAAGAVAALVARFRGSGQAVGSLDDLKLPVRAGIDWAVGNSRLKANDPAVRAGLERVFGMPPEKLVTSPEFREAVDRLADTIYAEALVPSGSRQVDQLTVAFKLLVFLTELGGSAGKTDARTVGELVGARTVVVSPPKPPPRASQPDEPQPPENPRLKRVEESRQKLAAYEQAHRELSNLAVAPGALTVAPEKDCEARLAALQARLDEVERKGSGSAGQDGGSGRVAGAPTSVPRLTLSPALAATLSDTARQVVAELRLDPARLEPMTAVGRIERQINAAGAELASLEAPKTYVMLGGVRLEKNALVDSLGLSPWLVIPPVLLRTVCQFQAGVGDLLMVRQKIKAYELGEFAHVENVLAGETRDREHRRLDTSEDVTTTEEETQSEKERDLQSTQRNEMQTEADKTVKQQFGLEAGLQVSGSYGPTVSFAAHLNTSFNTASEETQRKAVSFSQEVTEKTSEKVSERVKRTVTRRVLQEIQEINKHSFVNTSPDKHVRGIYRWLNKVYDAQVFNYGQRMMFEFVVPEPAAWFLYAMVTNPPGETEIVKPDPPTYGGEPLKPSHLTRSNYQGYVAKYQARGVPAPPPEFQNAAYFDKQDKVQDGSDFGRAAKIDVPAGYEAVGATVMSDYAFTKGETGRFVVMVGGTAFDHSGVWGAEYRDFDAHPRELSISYLLMRTWAFTLGVDVWCRLSDEGFTKWQQQVFDAVTEAYLRQKADYEEKLAAQELQRGPANFGRNPLENTRIVKEELKKLVLMMLTGTDVIARNSYYTSSEPLMRLDKACANGSYIRFFENAFEWTNIVYVLYPYFWGRHARWVSAVHLTDPDTDFAAFLRAGAARVQVPVRPGFEKAVVHFLQFGELWNGNDPPMHDDDLYVPVVDEIAANLGKFDADGVPYPPGSAPWEVRIPTELVVVQNLEEIPNIVDVLSGKPINLKG